ncbi:hypothetical protein FHG87_005630 [Trinorchestia longiramus]|nr:hypothetical protein FHG87_005630 [Trinorchestia longiramus]
MYRVLKKDLGKKPYKLMKRHELTKHPKNPDLNPLDFSIWSILKTRVLATAHSSLEFLKAKLQRGWETIPQKQICAACDAFVNRLTAVVRNKGGYIE